MLASNGRADQAVGFPLVGRAFADAVDPEASGAKWNRMLAAARSTPAGVHGELILVAPDASTDPRAVSIVPDDAGAGLWLVEHPREARLDHLRDEVTGVNSELASTQRTLVKERARLARALAAAERDNRTLDEFAHVVSHDLKAPLRALGNYAQWIRDDLGDATPPAVVAHADALQAQVRAMRGLIDGALAYARAVRDDADVERVDLRAMVADLVTLLAPPPAVRIVIDGALPVLDSARAPLQHVLQNLLDNAIRHAGRVDPAVRVSALVEGDRVRVSVADNGIGIAASQQDRIWELFRTAGTRVSATGSAPAVDMSGVGLAIVRRVVEAHGGRAWVASAPGTGAAFHFTWPLHPLLETRS